MDTVDLRIGRALINASIVCPAAACGTLCQCVGYVPGELAIFACRGCNTRYFVGLGAQPVLRIESTASANEVA